MNKETLKSGADLAYECCIWAVFETDVNTSRKELLNAIATIFGPEVLERLRWQLEDDKYEAAYHAMTGE